MSQKKPNINIKKIYAYIIDAPQTSKTWGLTSRERLQRLFAKIEIEIISKESVPPTDGMLLLVREDVVYDASIIKGLLNLPNTLVEQEKDNNKRFPVAAFVPVADFKITHSWLSGEKAEAPKQFTPILAKDAGGIYQKKLHKSEVPYCIIVTDNTNELRLVEKRIFMAAYKGVTDLVTKYAWPIPAMWVTRWCARFNFSPNLVTSIGFTFMLAATWFFLQGHYGAGLLCGWIMTFLDTVDGKLARVTLTDSSFGDIFDHGIDLIHPPFWYLAWAIGLGSIGLALSPPIFDIAIITIFLGYILGRLAELYFILRFGFDVHVWRRFDSLFRLVSARRNPNIIILTATWLVGAADIGIIAVAVWTLLTLLIHTIQITQAEYTYLRKKDIASWLK